MNTRYVLVHVSLGCDGGYNPKHARRILRDIKDKSSIDIVVLSNEREFAERERYAKEWNIPVERFYYSYDGHLDDVNLPSDYFIGTKAVVMGYSYSLKGNPACINNVVLDLVIKAKKVEISQDKVNVVP